MAELLHIGSVAIPGRVLCAPMTGISDLPFRRTAVKLGAGYVATEMVASEMLARGRPDMMRRAAVGEGLPLMVIQLVGRDAQWMARGAAIAEAAGADIIDINMGCPAKEVTGGASGSALMRDLDLAERLIAATVNATNVPVTLKMRLGWDERCRNGAALAVRAQASGIRAITVHGRTRQQFFKGEADWQAVAEIKAATNLPVIVNGDIVDGPSARKALDESKADAVMVGRGLYGQPWRAAQIEDALSDKFANADPDMETRLAIVLEHLRESLGFYGDVLGLKNFKKHLGWYVQGAPFPETAEERRTAKAAICRMEAAGNIETALTALWSKATMN